MKSLNYEEVTSAISKDKSHSLEISILLDRPQSDMNIGHIFRLSDAADIKHVYLLNPSKHINWQKIEKLSRKNSRHIPYSILESVNEVPLKSSLIALEWTDKSQSILHSSISERRFTLVVGNEKNGIQDSLLAICKQSIHLPMYGKHSSMNMAMATSIAVYQCIAKDISTTF